MSKTGIGSVYRGIAYDVALHAGRSFPELVLNAKDIESIESYVKIQPYIRAVCRELRRQLEKRDIVMPANLADILIYDDLAWHGVEELVSEMNTRLTEFQKMTIVVYLLKAVHNAWILDNSKEFFSGREEIIRRFVACELIGYCDVVDWYYPYVKRITMLFGWRFNDGLAVLIHRRTTEDFYERNGIRDESGLTDVVRRGVGCPLSEEILEKLEEPEGEKLARKMLMI